MSSQVYEPVTSFYSVPLISFRDVIWPDRDYVDSNRDLFSMTVSIHPAAYVHQLIADTLSYW